VLSLTVMSLTRWANAGHMRKIFLITVAALAIFACVVFAIWVRNVQHVADRLAAVGRISQLHLSLANYQSLHGTLPARYSFDTNGNPTFSWVASVLPLWEKDAVLDQLDTTKPWNVPENVHGVNLGGAFWDWYCSDGWFPCALKGDCSIWKDNGEPRGELDELPDSVVLVSIAVEDVHPLQPFAVTETQLKELLSNGSEVLFICANGTSGQVRLEEGNLVFGR